MILLKRYISDKMRRFANLVFSYLSEAYFPSFCVNCHTVDDLQSQFLCRNCSERIELIKSPCCPACGRLNSAGQYCTNCRSKAHLTGLVVAAKFEGPVKELVHYLKYGHMQAISKTLGEFMAKKVSISKFRGPTILVPVPLHFFRQLNRGFNQSDLLSKFISKSLSIPQIEALKRVKNTDQQMKLNRRHRLRNLEGAFQCLKCHDVIGKTVLLVDDVYTTGSTLNECAKVLRAAGARQVYGVVVARG